MATGLAVMIAGIALTGVAGINDRRLFFGFLVTGAALLVSGILTRMHADPVFAPPRLHDGTDLQPVRTPRTGEPTDS